jgi:hypothetical protein
MEVLIVLGMFVLLIVAAEAWGVDSRWDGQLGDGRRER